MKAHFTYTGIRVKDLDASVRFYTHVLGMTEIRRSEIPETGGQLVYLASDDGGHPLELNHYDRGSPYDGRYAAGDGLDHLAFQVDDLDRALAEARKEGHPVVEEIRTAGSRWAYIQDPDGIWIELFAWTADMREWAMGSPSTRVYVPPR